MANELRKCPFCGGKGETISKFMTVKGKEHIVYRIRCEECYAQSPYKRNAYLHGFHETLNSAVEAWNWRVEG